MECDKNEKLLCVISEALHVQKHEISPPELLNAGYTNYAYRFQCRGQDYIFRVPKDATNLYIDRANEMLVYSRLWGQGICTAPVYMDQQGYKISHYLNHAHTCRDGDAEEIRRCMQLLRKVHSLGIRIDASLDLFAMTEYYESLFHRHRSVHPDYPEVRERCMRMKPYVQAHCNPSVLAHLDCNPDNFLLYSSDGTQIQTELIDWEYAGMCDPLVDLGGFITYRPHDKEYADMVIRMYFDGNCDPQTRLLVYAYIALWGLYSSNWSEVTAQNGANLSGYAENVYFHAQRFSVIFWDEFMKYQKGSVD